MKINGPHKSHCLICLFLSFSFTKGFITYFNFVQIKYKSLFIVSLIGSFIVFLFFSSNAFLYCSDELIEVIFISLFSFIIFSFLSSSSSSSSFVNIFGVFNKSSSFVIFFSSFNDIISDIFLF